MARKSTAELSQFPRVNVRATRLQVPADVPASLAVIVSHLIATHDAAHFRAGDEYLLTQYAQSVRLSKQAFARLEEEGPILEGRPNPWVFIWEKATRTSHGLAARLRLAPQMRESARSAARAPKPAYPEPWKNEA